MHILRSIRILLAILCFLCFGMVLTSSVFAGWVAEQRQPIKDIDDVVVIATVYIDTLEYDPAGEGVVYLDGGFSLMNYNDHRGCTYTFEVRLELFKQNKKTGKWDTCTPDAKTAPLIFGTLDEADEPWVNYYAFGSDSVNLHIPCLDGDHPPGGRYKAKATVTLNVTQNRWTESYQILQHELPPFQHEPQGGTGLGATDRADGDTFLGECSAIGGVPWHSLIKTDTPYIDVNWCVKAPGDTRARGTWIEMDIADGFEETQANMTYLFPEDVDDPNKPGDQQGVYYTIYAIVYKWDGTVYSESYKVWVNDKK